MAVLYVLRLLMFTLSFVLQDWALHELLPIKRQRAVALMLVASSYVTWTYQMHTFSNSIETIVVLWCLVLMKRMEDDRHRTQVRLCVALAFLGVLGFFNRITFPAFLVVGVLQLVPHLLMKPLRAPIILLSAAMFATIAITTDTEYYAGYRLHFRELSSKVVVTPYNNLIYNLDSTNLAEHGLHPFWQHFVANLPQLIGPAFPLLVLSSRKDALFWSGIIGTATLSCFKHQEARFLLPAVPLLLASVKIPTQYPRPWIGLWIGFNVLVAVIFGIYHQGGVVTVQSWIAQQQNITEVFWWKTYSPPRWLLGYTNSNTSTIDLMGRKGAWMTDALPAAPCTIGFDDSGSRSYLVFPTALQSEDHLRAIMLEDGSEVVMTPVFEHKAHVGLDSLDFAEDGIWGTLHQVVHGRGLTVWDLRKSPRQDEAGQLSC
ncbi:hypothetical protein EJ03DRAFT_119474 [Teratosphaeria nubilosa]|uniref:Mannosyltransferase n=1 Tax=Teratosphaeria nubilosa TaxID=161662 RepID=A0A6G1L6D3_9PEZI|nr:hypothetical protein EJ03DRAFT_119474 [Teratosphaeria nubilosa]